MTAPMVYSLLQKASSSGARHACLSLTSIWYTQFLSTVSNASIKVKYKARIRLAFIQLHSGNGIALKPLPGTRTVRSSQPPPAQTEKTTGTKSAFI